MGHWTRTIIGPAGHLSLADRTWWLDKFRGRTSMVEFEHILPKDSGRWGCTAGPGGVVRTDWLLMFETKWGWPREVIHKALAEEWAPPWYVAVVGEDHDPLDIFRVEKSKWVSVIKPNENSIFREALAEAFWGRKPNAKALKVYFPDAPWWHFIPPEMDWS